MLPELSKIKGIHPGVILNREIKARGLKSKEFAFSIKEYPQTLSAILNKRRGINPQLSIKLGRNFNVDEDYFMLLQAAYDVKEAIIPETKTPDLSKIRRILFWDTEYEKIDWLRQKKAIIKRVFERGDDIEINEIISFYGRETIMQELKGVKNDFLPSFNENLKKHKLLLHEDL